MTHFSGNNSGIEVISSLELDSHDSRDSLGPVNLLREKTFTPELSSLVSRIFTNESGIEEPVRDDDALIFSEKNRVLLEYEKLIYRLIHSVDFENCDSMYNPFQLDIDVFDDIDDLEDYLKEGFRQCGFSEFALFRFNLKDEAFLYHMGNISPDLRDNCFFGINDPLWEKNFPDEGIIIEKELIDDDPFLNKKFIPGQYQNQNRISYYINRLSHLIDNVTDNHFSHEETIIDKYTSPVILIPLDEEKNQAALKIYLTLRKNLSVPLYIYSGKNRLLHESENYDYTESFLLIRLFRKISGKTDLAWYSLAEPESQSIESFFMLKYLLSKMKSHIGSNSLILRVGSNQIIMALTSDNAGIINKIIDDYNSKTGYIVILNRIDYNGPDLNNKIIELFL